MGRLVTPDSPIEPRPTGTPRTASFFGSATLLAGSAWAGIRNVPAKVFQPSARKIDLVLDLYKASDYIEVTEYLQTYPFLVDLLIELHEKAQQYFGSNTQVALRVVTDPEAQDYRELFAVIQTSLPRERARAALHRLDDDWWLDEIDRAQCKLTVDVEYS